MKRRQFVKFCAAAAAVPPASAAAARDLKPRLYARTRLVDERRQPLKAATLVAGENYIFHYPYQSTPCFLLNLGRPTVRNVELATKKEGRYLWPGGVGPGQSVVAYSAICAHRMTYPTRQISFISYRDRSTASKISRPNMIHCCSEHSEFDPASGARVQAGPAPQPLSAILLEHDPATDGLYAFGTLGGEMFDEFFAKFEFRLGIEYGPDAVRRPIAANTIVTPLATFCKQQVRC